MAKLLTDDEFLGGAPAQGAKLVSDDEFLGPSRSEIDQQLDQPYFPRSATKAGIQAAKDRPIEPPEAPPAPVRAPVKPYATARSKEELFGLLQDAIVDGATDADVNTILNKNGVKPAEFRTWYDKISGTTSAPQTYPDTRAVREVGGAPRITGEIKPITQPEVGVGSVLAGVGKATLGQLRDAQSAVRMAGADLAGNPDVTAREARAVQQRQLENEMATPDITSTTGKALYSGAVSIGQNAASLAAGVATGSPFVALASMVGPMALAKYSEYRAEKVEPLKAAVAAFGQGAVEWATEKLPMGALLKDLSTKAGFGKILLHNLKLELPGEQAATVLQDAIDQATLHPEKSWSQYLAERPAAAYQTLVATALQSGVMTGAAHTARKIGDALTPGAPAPQARSLFNPDAVVTDLVRGFDKPQPPAPNPQVFQSPAAEAAGLPPLVVPPKSPAVAAAEAAAQAEKAPEGGKTPPAGETAPAQAAPIAVAPTPQPAAAAVPGAPTGFEDFTGPEAAAEILGPATPSGNTEPPAAPAAPAVAPSGNTAAIAPTAQVTPQTAQGAPQTAQVTPQVDRGVDAAGRLTELLQDARKGYDRAQHEYETTGRDTTYKRLRAHLLKSFTPLLGRKDAQAYVQYLTEEGGLGGGDLGTGSEYFDLATQALAKQAAPDARASKADPAAPAPIDLPESFPTKSEANLFAVRNKLTDVRAVQSGVGWTLAPYARPETDQEAAQNERHVQTLDQVLNQVGAPDRVVPVRDTGTESGVVTRAIGQVFGFPQVVVRGLASNAVYYRGVSYVSDKLDTAARVVHGALHEAFHWAVQNHPDVAERYLDAIGPRVNPGVLEARRDFENKHKLPGERAFPLTAGRGTNFGKVNSAEEENAGDVWGGMGLDPQLWVEMRQKDPGLFQAIRYRFLETLARAIDVLSRKGIRVRDLVTEYEKARDATSTAMAEVAKRSRAPAAETIGQGDKRDISAPQVTEPDVRASKLDEDMVKRDDGSREYALSVERDERKRAKRAVLTNEERAAVEHDAAVHGVDAKEWIAKAEKTKKSYPESAGWAPLRLVGLTNEEETDENGDVKKDIKLKWQQQGYGFQIPPGKTKGPTSIDTRWAEQLAVRVAAEVRSVLKRAAAGDRNAMIIVQHQTWYRNMAMILRRAFGGKGDFFADLLGATSPQTDAPTNWRSAVDIIKRFSQGEFRREMKAAQEWLAAGKELRDMPGGDKIRKLSGKLYGINSPNAVRALLNLYRNIEPDSAPKAKNFAMNLIGESDMATIDVWAARMLRRMAQAVEKAGYERIPPPAEKGVSGKWNVDATEVGGEFGFGAAVLRLASTILKDEGIDVSAPDLQAVAWFIEKELWTQKNWTSKSGEGGSFEEQVDRAQPERLITGWTIATSESAPSDAQMSVAQARVLTVLRGDDTVLAARALPTTGMYAGDTERSFDNEIVVTPGFDPRPLVAEIARIAREAKQYDIFVSKVLHDSASSANARPGVEIYFRGQKAFDEARSVLDEVVANGLDGFTLVVDPRTENSDAPGSEVGKYVGVRLQYIPEIEMRWLDPTSDRYKTLSSGTPAEIAAIIDEKAKEMVRAADKIRERADVAHSSVRWYDTVVIGKENYSDYADGAGTEQEAPGRTGKGAWFGQPLGEVLARADSRLRGDGRQEPDGGVRDGGVAGVQPAGADVRRSRIDEAAGSAEPADRPRGSGIAGAQRGAEDARGWSKRSPQPLSVSVDAWHYGLERTGVLSGLYYGRGIKGKERERVFADRDWRVQRRVYFYIPKDDGSLPAKEDGLGNHRYEVRLGNLYDGAVGDARVGPSTAADFETKVLDAGYDGYISRKLGMAVVLNADVPATYKGIDQHGPARAEPAAQARLKKALLRGEIDAVDKALPALKAADPTLRARNGSVEYDPAARDALNAVGADGLPRFSKAFKEWFGDSKAVVAVNADTGGPIRSSREPKRLVPQRMYHSTQHDFSTFEIGREATNSGTFGNWTTKRSAIFVTPDLEASQEYARGEGRFADGASVMPLYVRAENPLDLTDGIGEGVAEKLAATGHVSERFVYNQMPQWGMFDGETGEAVVAAIRAAGYDSVIFNDENPATGGSFESWALFSPEQIKSAIGNNGEYDPANPDIRRSIANGTSNWDSTQSGRLDDLIYNLQDKQVDLKRIQKQITDAGNKLSIRSDAYLREELYHGRVADRTLNFLNDELQPLFTEMRAANVTLPALEQYLHARHAEERNLYLESINQNTPNNTDLSGMSTADANAILASARPVMQTLAARVDRIINGTRDLMEIAGLEDPTDVASLRGAYQHYVPLHRDEAHPGTRPITNSGFSVKGTNIKRALGSHAAVTNILAHVVAAREAEITRAEKNAVALAVYALARNNPNPDFWSTDTPPKAPWLDPRKEVYNPGTGQMEPNPNYNQVVMRADPNWARQPNVLAAKLNGVEVGVIFNEHDERAVRMVTSLKNLDVNGLDAAAKVIAKATRWQAAVNTSFSPVFMVTNLLRDVHGAAVNLTSTEISGKQVTVLAGATPAARAIYRAERGKAINDPVWGPLYAEFKRRGAKTGYRDAYVDIEDRARALQKEIDALDRKAPARVAHAIADFMADANTTTENAVRLSAYKVAIDQGIHPDRAASIAKNLTVNFNRKGAKTQGIGAFYAFFNAAVQGTARTAETLTGKGAAKVIAGGLLLGVLQSLMYAGMDDEDEEAIPDYVKRTSIVIPLKHSYIAIPMPLGLHVVPNVGRTIADVALALRSGDGRQVAGKIWSLVGTLFDTLNPLGSSETPLQMAAPTVADPFVQLWTNQNFVGNPVYRERGRDDQGAPGYTLGRDSTNPFYKGAAYVIHMLGSGMNPYSRNTSLPAALSPQPEAIRLFPETIFGGLWRETEKLVDTTIALATGQPVDPNRVPMASRFYGDTTSNSAVASVFWKNVSKVSEVEREEKRARKDGGTPPQREDSPLVAGAKTARTQVLGLMGRRRQADINGATPTALREFDDKIAEVMRAFNKQAREAHKK